MVLYTSKTLMSGCGDSPVWPRSWSLGSTEGPCRGSMVWKPPQVFLQVPQGPGQTDSKGKELLHRREDRPGGLTSEGQPNLLPTRIENRTGLSRGLPGRGDRQERIHRQRHMAVYSFTHQLCPLGISFVITQHHWNLQTLFLTFIAHFLEM